VVQALHWFNPFAWLAVSGWKNFREEAADETALEWLGDANGEVYGETLLQILRLENNAAIPFGSLAIAESMRNLRTRIIMIKNYRKKSACYGLLGILTAALMAIALVVPARAESDQDKVMKSMVVWLEKNDDGKYAESWQDASELFRENVSKETWVKQMESGRPGLGKCLQRKANSVMPMTELPSPSGPMKGDFLMVNFYTDFANAKNLAELVTFEKDANGEWKVSGYYIKPR
jgi:hypothetical protein